METGVSVYISDCVFFNLQPTITPCSHNVHGISKSIINCLPQWKKKNRNFFETSPWPSCMSTMNSKEIMDEIPTLIYITGKWFINAEKETTLED